MKDYKVFFRVTEKYNNYIEEAKGNRIEVFNGDTIAYMPVPATYLIDQNKVIKYVHYDPDYKNRSDLKEVITQLKD
jgi:peroxiredoxin